jgi:hypothetical protein
MRNETIVRTKILGLLETVQEFIDTNPNEATALADSALLIQAMHADLNPKDVAEVN